MDKLTFEELRAANVARLPLFKNSQGLPAHSKPDGSDWSDAQWLGAVLGELGEYANLRKKYDRGDIGPVTFLDEAAKELADIQTYLDILAFRLGIDLGAATRAKFNQVSKRVQADVFLGTYGVQKLHTDDCRRRNIARPSTCDAGCFATSGGSEHD
jgi:NTP pyrophosphatase (non-canonical NTP hydrolase)